MQKFANARIDEAFYQRPKLSKNDDTVSQTHQVTLQIPNLVALPEVPPAFDLWGVLPVLVDQDYLVAVIILAKEVSSHRGLATQVPLASLWSATQNLKTHILSSLDKADQFAAMLSKAIVHPSFTGGGFEIIQGADGYPSGFLLGDSYVQVVMTCIVLTDDLAHPNSPNLFPIVPNDIVDTYLLPANTDMVEFGQYISAKNLQVYGEHHRNERIVPRATRLERASQICIIGGASLLIYVIIISFFAPDLSLTAPIILSLILMILGLIWIWYTCAGKRDASKYLQQMHWRVMDQSPELLREISSRLSSTHAAQMAYEIGVSSTGESNNSSRERHLPTEQADNRANAKYHEQARAEKQEPKVELPVKDQVCEEQVTQDDTRERGNTCREIS